MPRNKTRKVSPCQGWRENTCLRVKGCTYVRGTKRRYCRSRPGAHRTKTRPPSSRTRGWKRVVGELRARGKRRTTSPTTPPRPPSKKQVKTTRRRRAPKGERVRLLRLQGELAAELKQVVAERAAVRATRTASAPPVRRRFLSERITND